MGPADHYWQVPPNVPNVKWQGGELLAWRVWRLGQTPEGSVLLVSAYRDTVWEGPVLKADYRPYSVPRCGSGIYALKPSTRPVRGHYDWALGGETWVRGWVALSGQVVEHRAGYRAERAVIRRLRLGPAAHRFFDTPERLAAIRHELEQRYQCPVKVGGLDARTARGFRSAVSLLILPRAVPTAAVHSTPWCQANRPAPASPSPTVPTAPAPHPARSPARPRGVSPDGIKYDALRRVFAQAQRALGTEWNLYGRGHCERVTLKAHYARHARLGAAESVRWFAPSGSMARVYVFPAELVHRAAAKLKIDASVLISRRW